MSRILYGYRLKDAIPSIHAPEALIVRCVLRAGPGERYRSVLFAIEQANLEPMGRETLKKRVYRILSHRHLYECGKICREHQPNPALVIA